MMMITGSCSRSMCGSDAQHTMHVHSHSEQHLSCHSCNRTNLGGVVQRHSGVHACMHFTKHTFSMIEPVCNACCCQQRFNSQQGHVDEVRSTAFSRCYVQDGSWMWRSIVGHYNYACVRKCMQYLEIGVGVSLLASLPKLLRLSHVFRQISKGARLGL
jgi:hypothetical protein